jgi:hypothetical protein
MGRGGLYYRKSLAKQGADDHSERDRESQLQSPQDALVMQEIESASTLQMTDSSSEDLLAEIRQKRQRVSLSGFAIGGSVLLLLILAFRGLPGWAFILVLAACLAMCLLARWADELRKSVVVFYDLESVAEKAYERVHESFAQIAGSARIWHVSAAGKVSDRKYYGGANTVVQRDAITPEKGELSFLKTNVLVPKIPVGKQCLAFLPDRLLVFEPSGVGAVSYESLIIEVSEIRFVESERVPVDSRVVDHTWEYVNKKGGPDRRFKDNRQLPVVIYEEIHFKSPSGLNELIQVSRVGTGENFTSAISEQARVSGSNGMSDVQRGA